MSKYLFGTALAGDVEALGTHVNNVARAVTQQNSVVTQTYKALALHKISSQAEQPWLPTGLKKASYGKHLKHFALVQSLDKNIQN